MVVMRIKLANVCKSLRRVPGIQEALCVSSLFIIVTIVMMIITEESCFPKGDTCCAEKQNMMLGGL